MKTNPGKYYISYSQLLLNEKQVVYPEVRILENPRLCLVKDGSQVFCDVQCTEFGSSALYTRSGVLPPRGQ